MGTCLLDLGNTRYKWIDSTQVNEGSPLRKTYSPQEAAAALCREVMATSSALQWRVASVKGEAFNHLVADAFRAQGGRVIRFAVIPATPPFGLAYREPQRFGIDRYLNLLAARDLYREPLIVIDAGTAVTVDALDAAGDHVGGIIFPGLGLLRQSLGAGTSLVTSDPAAATLLLGNTTESCVNGGSYHGLQGAVERIVRLMTQQLGGHVTIIVTGGDAEVIAPALQSNATLDPNLLLKGLGKL
jgi:type III pantothenate kinase